MPEKDKPKYRTVTIRMDFNNYVLLKEIAVARKRSLNFFINEILEDVVK